MGELTWLVSMMRRLGQLAMEEEEEVVAWNA